MNVILLSVFYRVYTTLIITAFTGNKYFNCYYVVYNAVSLVLLICLTDQWKTLTCTCFVLLTSAKSSRSHRIWVQMLSFSWRFSLPTTSQYRHYSIFEHIAEQISHFSWLVLRSPIQITTFILAVTSRQRQQHSNSFFFVTFCVYYILNHKAKGR